MNKFRIFVILLIAGMSIFYACEKEGKDRDFEKKLKTEMLTEAEFIAKNYDGTCVQVTIFRDEKDNAQFVTKKVADDPEVAISFMVSDALNIKPRETEDEFILDIPNDAIYWLVPFDEGYEPMKFTPSKNEKAASSGYSSIYCICREGTELRNSHCEKKHIPGGNIKCMPKHGGKCTICTTHTTAVSSSSKAVFVGSCYLVKSNFINVNGIIYE